MTQAVREPISGRAQNPESQDKGPIVFPPSSNTKFDAAHSALHQTVREAQGLAIAVELIFAQQNGSEDATLALWSLIYALRSGLSSVENGVLVLYEAVEADYAELIERQGGEK